MRQCIPGILESYTNNHINKLNASGGDFQTLVELTWVVAGQSDLTKTDFTIGKLHTEQEVSNKVLHVSAYKKSIGSILSVMQLVVLKYWVCKLWNKTINGLL